MENMKRQSRTADAIRCEMEIGRERQSWAEMEEHFCVWDVRGHWPEALLETWDVVGASEEGCKETLTRTLGKTWNGNTTGMLMFTST